MIIGFFGVLFTGQWPEGMRAMIVDVMRKAMKLNAYFLLTRRVPAVSGLSRTGAVHYRSPAPPGSATRSHEERDDGRPQEEDVEGEEPQPPGLAPGAAQPRPRSVCPRCGAAKLPHVVCGNCGWYHGRQAIEVE